MPSGLTLTIDSLSLNIPRHFLKSQLPRIRPKTPELERSAYGTAGLDGRLFIPHVWEVEVLLLTGDRDVLKTLWALALGNREPIRIYDYTDRFEEIGGVNTRAIAPDSSAVTANGTTSYHAQFDVYPVGDLSISKNGANWRVEFVLEELAIVVPD